MNKLNTLIPLCALIAMMAVILPGQASDKQRQAEAWTPAKLRVTLETMPEGDPVRGREINQNLMCASCHGDKGIAPTANWPNLAGQKADYTYKTLLDYQSGLRSEDRRSALMTTLAAMMDKQAMADVAVYYASLSAAEQQSKTEPQTDHSDNMPHVAEKLVRQGDTQRLITPCASCHGLHGQGGINAAPALAGQNAQAFIRTMQLYQSGQRNNDVNQVMSQIARKLSGSEIRLLASYYHFLQ